MAKDNARRELLYEQYEELMFRIALTEMQDQDMATLESEPVSEAELAEADAFFRRVEGKTIKLIDSTFKRQHVRRTLAHTLPRASIVIAAALLVFFVGLTAAVAVSPPVRMLVLKLISGREYAQLGMGLEAAEVPAQWPGTYYPAFIPNEFTLARVDQDFCTVSYAAPPNFTLRFAEYASAREVAINTEGAIVSKVRVGDLEMDVAEQGNHTSVSWSTSDRYFTLTVDASRELAIKIAENVRKVR